MNVNPVLTLHTCHLRHTSSVRYLRPRMSKKSSQRVSGGLADEYRRLHKQEAYFMAPSFASGRVLADAMLDRLISQAYFNPLIIPLFHALVASSSAQYSVGNISTSTNNNHNNHTSNNDNYHQQHHQQLDEEEKKHNEYNQYNQSSSPRSTTSTNSSPYPSTSSPNGNTTNTTNTTNTPNTANATNASKSSKSNATTQSFLIHVEVPIRFIGRTFSEVFDKIMEQKG